MVSKRFSHYELKAALPIVFVGRIDALLELLAGLWPAARRAPVDARRNVHRVACRRAQTRTATGPRSPQPRRERRVGFIADCGETARRGIQASLRNEFRAPRRGRSVRPEEVRREAPFPFSSLNRDERGALARFAERGVYAASTSLLHTASHYFETVPHRAMKRPKGRAPTFRPSRVVVYPAACSVMRWRLCRSLAAGNKRAKLGLLIWRDNGHAEAAQCRTIGLGQPGAEAPARAPLRHFQQHAVPAFL